MNNPIHLLLPRDSKKSRSAIIAENIFAILKKRNIKLADFARAINVDASTIYKWKNGNNDISTDRFDAAAKYLNVTANDLFYDEKEKVGMPRFEEPSTEAKLAQKIIVVRRYRKVVSKPGKLLILSAILTLLFSLITFFLVKLDVFWGLVSLGTGIVFIIWSVSSASDEETLIVQHTDEVYYKAVSKGNPIFKKNLWFRGVSFLAYIGFAVSIFFTYRGMDQEALFIISLILATFGFMASFMSFVEIPRSCPEFLEDFSFGPFYLFVVDLALSTSLIAFSIAETAVVPAAVWPGILCGCLSALSDGASLWLSGQLFSQFKMVIDKGNNDIEELYRQ
jgi:transcriptional regulator with XRE-family HTH domain